LEYLEIDKPLGPVQFRDWFWGSIRNYSYYPSSDSLVDAEFALKAYSFWKKILLPAGAPSEDLFTFIFAKSGSPEWETNEGTSQNAGLTHTERFPNGSIREIEIYIYEDVEERNPTKKFMQYTETIAHELLHAIIKLYAKPLLSRKEHAFLYGETGHGLI
jgi:hypothetical protein